MCGCQLDSGIGEISAFPGIRLGPYEIIAPLSSGGMGEVWLATVVRLGRKAALNRVTFRNRLRTNVAEDQECQVVVLHGTCGEPVDSVEQTFQESHRRQFRIGNHTRQKPFLTELLTSGV
jgi:hypothetical protein